MEKVRSLLPSGCTLVELSLYLDLCLCFYSTCPNVACIDTDSRRLNTSEYPPTGIEGKRKVCAVVLLVQHGTWAMGHGIGDTVTMAIGHPNGRFM